MTIPDKGSKENCTTTKTSSRERESISSDMSAFSTHTRNWLTLSFTSISVIPQLDFYCFICFRTKVTLVRDWKGSNKAMSQFILSHALLAWEAITDDYWMIKGFSLKLLLAFPLILWPDVSCHSWLTLWWEDEMANEREVSLDVFLSIDSCKTLSKTWSKTKKDGREDVMTETAAMTCEGSSNATSMSASVASSESLHHTTPLDWLFMTGDHREKQLKGDLRLKREEEKQKKWHSWLSMMLQQELKAV